MSTINSGADVVKKEPTSFYRWMVLLFLSIAMFGNYYVYDSISLVADQLKHSVVFCIQFCGIARINIWRHTC